MDTICRFPMLMNFLEIAGPYLPSRIEELLSMAWCSLWGNHSSQNLLCLEDPSLNSWLQWPQAMSPHAGVPLHEYHTTWVQLGCNPDGNFMPAYFSIVTGIYILFYSAFWRTFSQSLLTYHFCGWSTLYIQFGMRLKIKFLLELIKKKKKNFIGFITTFFLNIFFNNQLS